jgi:hypothetical protein
MDTHTISKVYNLIILDESGSMESIKQPTINGFNELLQSIKRSAGESPEIEQWVNAYSFNGIIIKEQVALTKAGEQKLLTTDIYRPDDMTPLYDAIGIAVNNLQKALHNKTGYSVLVTILTDGEENNSKEYTSASIGALITALKSKGWVFTYIGANHNVEKTAISINISNHLSFNSNPDEVNQVFEKNDRSRKAYMDKVKRNEKNSLQEDFFKDIDPGEN